MKKVTIVRGQSKGFKAFFFEKKGWLLCSFAFVILFLLFTAVPMSGIPGMSRLAALLGLPYDATRSLTLSDLAAYAAGRPAGERVAAAIEGGGYRSIYDSAGGLSPFSNAIYNPNRLLDAREAYMREYQLTGKYPQGVAGPMSMTPGYNYNPDAALYAAAGVPVNGAGFGVAPDINGARGEATAPNPAAGYPLGFDSAAAAAAAEAAAGAAAGTEVEKLKNSPKPYGVGDISGSAGTESYLQRALENSASGFKGGRSGAMGGFNAQVSRIGVNGRGQMAFSAYGDLGWTYGLSYTASQTGYKTTAKHIADSAFDGGEVAEETLVVPGEKEEVIPSVGSPTPPSTTINRMTAAQKRCTQGEEYYGRRLDSLSKQIDNGFGEMKQIGKDSPNPNGVPGSCNTSGFGRVWDGLFCRKCRDTHKARDNWNSKIEGLKTLCQDYQKVSADKAKACGMRYENDTPCDKFEDLRLARAAQVNFNGGCWKKAWAGDMKDADLEVMEGFFKGVLGTAVGGGKLSGNGLF
jgi:hypothetical protein